MPPRRGWKIYLAGSVVGQICALLRYTLLARLLGPEQLGLVAALVLVSNFFEMISDTGSDRFLVQDKAGDEPEVQRLVQLVFLGRGAFMATALVIFAYPIAGFFGEPALVVGLAVMAISPLLGGWMHLDVRRFQRGNDFRAEGLGQLVAEVLSLAATVTAALITRDFTAVLYGLIVRSAVVVIVSHLCAERPYRVGYSQTTARRLQAFALPLLGNGVLMFIASQSDRLMISRLIGMEALGLYSATMLLVLYPMVALNRFFTGIHLPIVAANPRTTGRGHAPDMLAGRALILTFGTAAGFAVAGPLAIRILYGEKFEQPLFLVALIGVLQAVRFVRTWPNTHALALGDSRNVMFSSLARLSGIPCAFAGLMLFNGIPGIVAGFIVGELAAMLTGMLMLNRSRGLAWAFDLDRFLGLIVGCALVLAAAAAVHARWLPGLVLVPAGLVYMAWLARREGPALTHGVQLLTKMVRRSR